jgi:uncharacterized protein
VCFSPMRHPINKIEPRRWRTLGRTVLFMFGCAVALAVASPHMPGPPGARQELALGIATTILAFALTVLFVRWDGVGLGDVGALPGPRSVPRFAFGILAGLLLVALCAGVAAVASEVRWSRTPGVGIGGAVVRLAAYVALAGREELAFRGYPLRRLERNFGVGAAQLLVAAAFALEHRIGGWPWTHALVGAGVGSLLFGMAAIVTRGLAVPIGMHAAWNCGEWALGLKGEAGLFIAVVAPGRERNADVVRTVTYVVVMVLATVAIWAWGRRANRAKQE